MDLQNNNISNFYLEMSPPNIVSLFPKNSFSENPPENRRRFPIKGEEAVERICLHHRLPFAFPDYESVNDIKREIESLSIDTEIEFGRIKLFFCVCFKSLLNEDQLKIYEYLAGNSSLDSIGLTRKNAAYFLRIVKIFDLAHTYHTRISRTHVLLKNSTFEIRTKILELLSPEMESVEAFTYTLDPKKLKNADYLKSPANWVPERIRFYAASLIPQEYIKMISLSGRLNEGQPRVYALRGTTASGKTTLIKERFPQAVDEKGELSGCINPDRMKFVLKTKTCPQNRLTNVQVHEEVVRGPLSCYKKAVLGMQEYSIILDTRLTSNEDVEEVINAARVREGKATVLDLDVPLQLSFQRVLATRNPWGKSACVPPAALKDGFLESRRCRIGVIERVKLADCVDRYELLRTDDKGNFQLIAEKKGSEFIILSDLFKKFLTPPSERKTEKKMQRRLDAGPWKGMTLEKALEYHASGTPSYLGFEKLEQESLLRRQYGSVNIEPFNGSWLSDFSEVMKFIHSEQLLHIRGADEEGVGLHWQTNKFAWKLNPQYNPESQGGFQMKMGYFIIPPSYADTYQSLSLSKQVLEELEIKSASGEMLGYRFFVHPEAYIHFYALFKAGIPFIQPEQSEFIGTPTSSYRSWVVRRVVENDGEVLPQEKTIPFIVKLGVDQLNDNSRLLSAAEVKKSIEAQKGFDEMENHSRLFIFKESFGITLKNISNYPSPKSICDLEPVDSGLVIREFPKELLEGKCKIFSFSALMSLERIKHPGICAIDNSFDGRLPLIYEIIHNAIQRGAVKTPVEFIERYLISDVLSALEPSVFKMGLSLALHGQNLCMVLDRDNLPIGIAIRDHGDIHRMERFLETFTWFYRYHVFIKLLNVVTLSSDYHLPLLHGSPIQIGTQPLPERSLSYYLRQKTDLEPSIKQAVAEALEKVGITYKDFEVLLKVLDGEYLSVLSDYFDLKEASDIQLEPLPAAEPDSSGDISKVNRRLWKNRIN